MMAVLCENSDPQNHSKPGVGRCLRNMFYPFLTSTPLGKKLFAMEAMARLVR